MPPDQEQAAQRSLPGELKLPKKAVSKGFDPTPTPDTQLPRRPA